VPPSPHGDGCCSNARWKRKQDALAESIPQNRWESKPSYGPFHQEGGEGPAENWNPKNGQAAGPDCM